MKKNRILLLLGAAALFAGCYLNNVPSWPGTAGFHPVSNSPFPGPISGMASQGEKAAAVNHDGIIAISEDSGLSWQQVPAENIIDNFRDGIHFNAVAAGEGFFLAGADNGRAAYSTDGLIWQAGVIGPMSPKTIRCAAIGTVLGKTVFVVAGDDGRLAHAIDSPRGPWYMASLSPFGDAEFSGEDVLALAWGRIKGNGVFVAAGQNGKIAILKDLSGKWYGARAGTGETFRSAAFGNDRFIVVGDRGTIKHSSNPFEYSWVSAANSGFGFRQLLGAAFDPVINHFVLYSADTVVGFSEFGEDWNAAVFSELFPYGISALTCTSSRIILGGADGSIVFSN